ncbi:MAG TPA: DUF4301 domain-containing protein [Flavobacterium sp.]|nr:DUF4301 domain-containing protein [Flavobacterium sp.]
MEKIFTKRDIKQIKEKGISLEKIEQQLFYFKNGIAKSNLEKCATLNDGILKFLDAELNELSHFFDTNKSQYSICKFVPASGAASRMFKFLLEFLTHFNSETDSINAYINRKKDHDLSVFLVGLKDFPFYNDVKNKVKSLYSEYPELDKDMKNYLFIKTLLAPSYFNFANKPKGVLPFHKINDQILNPVQEHINEVTFFKEQGKKPKIHFTVSKEHLSDFEEITNKYPDVDCTFSFQNETTDTIAVTIENEPFRKSDGSLLFRPGGHGALIENLNKLNADIIFIKNIDNVSPNHFETIISYKKVIGGLLLKTQNKIFKYLKQLEQDKLSDATLTEIEQYATEYLNISLPSNFDKFQSSYKQELLFKELNKPIRVCGMVKNEGETGGGPFWVKNNEGLLSLQIVETSQIDLKNKDQKKIVSQSTHFNPADLVCGIKDYKNNKFNLTNFVDANTGFIVEKNKFGKVLKSFELPGLWNGAMAHWITIFVEVPITTFNPVKSVNDLLKPAHQPREEIYVKGHF